MEPEQETTEWFTAEVILEINVQDDPRNVIHRNLILIRAATREEAYAKALQLGSESAEGNYLNPAGKQVQFRFRGIGYLGPVDDGLVEGAELLYTEHIAVPEETIQRWIVPREQLINRKRVPKIVPDYRSGEVVAELRKLCDEDLE